MGAVESERKAHNLFIIATKIKNDFDFMPLRLKLRLSLKLF